MINIIEKSEIVFIFILLNSFVWAGGGTGGNITFLDIITVAFVIGFLMFVIRKYFNKMIDSWEDERIENIKTTNKEIEIMNEEIEIKSINEEENNINNFNSF